MGMLQTLRRARYRPWAGPRVGHSPALEVWQAPVVKRGHSTGLNAGALQALMWHAKGLEVCRLQSSRSAYSRASRQTRSRPQRRQIPGLDEVSTLQASKQLAGLELSRLHASRLFHYRHRGGQAPCRPQGRHPLCLKASMLQASRRAGCRPRGGQTQGGGSILYASRQACSKPPRWTSCRLCGEYASGLKVCATGLYLRYYTQN